MGKYSGLAPEEIDTAASLDEADYLLDEYQLAFGGSWELWIEAVSRDNPTCQCYRRNNFIPAPSGYYDTVSAALDRRNPRVVDRWEEKGEGRNKSERCKICGKATREGKDLCTDHIGESPYAKKLAERLAQMKGHDEEAAENRVDISVENETIKELLLILKLSGPRTIERLARELNRDTKIITNYVNALVKKRLVKTDSTKRGSTMVMLAIQ
jgi:predicted transcriptional regulator